jgi:hypothetical protein
MMNRGAGKVARARWSQSRCAWPAFLASFSLLSFSLACVRPSGVLRGTDANSSSTSRGIPFHVAQSSNGDAAEEGAAPDVPISLASPDQLPFRVASLPRTVQRGTLLTVELGKSLAPARIRPGDAFPATVTEPVAFDGGTVIDAGTAVTGRVESAQAPGPQVGLGGTAAGILRAGYVRLTLSAITVGGKSISLQTSSLFARTSVSQTRKASGNDSSTAGDSGSVPRGRRLTFRLTAPLTLDVTSALAARQSPNRAPERTKE